MRKIILTLICATLASTLIAQEKALTREEKVYTLSHIWKEMHYNFAFPETLQQINIDSLYMAYIPKIEQTKNKYEYYRVLCAFMAHFNEAHTRIFTTSQRPDDTVPLQVTNIGETVIVSNIVQHMAGEIPVGSEIIQVSHMPTVDYIKEFVYPYIAAATPHWKFDKSVSEMFYGEPQSVVHVKIRTPKGKEREMELTRNYHSEFANEPMIRPHTPPIDIKTIDKNIGYIKLNSCYSTYVDTINAIFNAHLPQLRKCKGIIVDVRGNRGGTDEAWNNIAFHLMPQAEFSEKGKWSTRFHTAHNKFVGLQDSRYEDFYKGTAMLKFPEMPYTNPVPNSLKLLQPLMIISGQAVASAAEDFVLIMKENERGTIIGEPSVGCVGLPIILPLPGNLNVMICIKKYTNADGTQPNETGIIPDIEVRASYSEYLKGKDNILDQAIQELRKQLNS